MRTILEKNEATIIRDRSSFIGIVLHATSKEIVEQYLKEIRKEYPKAKHYCYAYIIDGLKKASDDGEPSGTAGRPLLELLEKRDFNQVLLVVVRYFGGILLGASRLLSTYIEAGSAVLNAIETYQIKEKFVYHINVSYSEFERLKYLAKRLSFSLENVTYETRINADILIEESLIHQLIEEFPNNSIDVFGKKIVYEKE